MARIRKTPRSRAREEMILQVPLFTEFPWLVHGFTTRHGGVSSFPASPHAHGDLNLGKVAWDSDKNVLANRRRMLAGLSAQEMTLITLKQIHSDIIRVAGLAISEVGDGLITDRPGFLLSILAADCLPVLLVDTKQRAVAAFHCGWRGTARALARKGVGRMKMMFGSREQDLRAAIGPGIRACCYQVGPEVVEEFEGQFVYAQKILAHRNHPMTPLQAKYARLFKTYKSLDEPEPYHGVYLDLVRANVFQLREAGVSPKHIYAEAPCTCCHPELFFSHRRDGGRTGRMMGVAGIVAS